MYVYERDLCTIDSMNKSCGDSSPAIYLFRAASRVSNVRFVCSLEVPVDEISYKFKIQGISIAMEHLTNALGGTYVVLECSNCTKTALFTTCV